MILSTHRKIALARAAFRAVMAARRLMGHTGTQAEATRGGIHWALDLSEGIDFAIWLTGAFEPSTQAACRRLIRPGDTILDIGANMGAHTLPFARWAGPGGRVIAFEPTQSAFRRLQRSLSLNPDLAARISAEQIMLGPDHAPAPTGIYSSWPLNPRHTLTDAHPLHEGVLQTTDGTRATTLDSYIERANVTRVDLIKIDVDGFEPDVLAGAHATLTRHMPRIVLEVAPYVLAERGHAPDSVVRTLSALGYRFHHLDGRPLAHDPLALVAAMPAGASINLLAHAAS